MASGVGTVLWIAGVGWAALGGLRFGAGPSSHLVAVLAPPWQPGGLIWAAGFDLPIVDLLWDGQVAVLDLSADAAAAARLRDGQVFLLDATSVVGCLGADDPLPLSKDLS